MNSEAIKVLLVDDDEEDYIITRNLLAKIEGGNFQIEWQGSYMTAVGIIKECRHDIYLIDYSLGQYNGVELVRLVAESSCKALVIMLTGQGELRIDMEAITAGAADYLIKGAVTPDGFERSFRHARERKRAAEELRQSEERYRSLVENSLGLICTHDLEGRLLSINPAAAQALGYQPDEIIGKNLQQFLPKAAHVLYGIYLLKIQQEAVSTGLMRLVTKDGAERIWEYTNSLQVESGKPSYVVGYAHDVTESRRNQQALRESEERYRDLFENSNDLIQIANPDGLIIYVNSAWKRVLGYEDDEARHLSFFDMVTPGSRAKCWELFAHAVAGENIDSFEAVFVAKDGREITVEGNIICSFKDGKTIWARGIFCDITERKESEAALIESEHRFRNLFYDAPVGYHELDVEGRITCVNTTELLMLGYSSEEMIGHHVWEFIEEAELARATFAEKIAGHKPLRHVDRSFRRKDGTYMPVQLDDQMLNDPNGRFIGIRATMQDITERKQIEEALTQSEQRLRDLFENASDLIYTADSNGNFTSLNLSGERM
ncbi:MAG: PAS domain S-box protein, partial [Acidobacteriota bacterium]